MTHTTLSISLPYAKLPVDFATLRSQATPWWQGLSTLERYRVWSGVAGVVLIVGMLLAFHQVVSGAVHHGEVRRVASAAQIVSAARCTAMRGLSAQETCRVQLAAAHNASALANGKQTLIAMR